MPSPDQFIAWIIVGLLGGTLAALMIRRAAEALGLSATLRSVSSAPLSAAGCFARSGFSPT